MAEKETKDVKEDKRQPLQEGYQPNKKGYQPDKGNLDASNPPRGGSGIPAKSESGTKDDKKPKGKNS